MTLEEYQELTNQTNLYPKEKMLDCLIHGITSEAGEMAGHLKKFYRGDTPDTGLRLLLKAEMGDLLWYISETCGEIGVTMSEVMEYNIQKLQKRMVNGTIRGNGDER